MRIISNIQQWNPERIEQAQQVIRRYGVDWYGVFAIADKVAETLPQLTPRIIRAHLDYRLEQAIAESRKPIPELAPDADDAQRYAHAYHHNPKNPLKNLLNNGSYFYEIEKFAKANPKDFLHAIWSWFTDVLSRIVEKEGFGITTYYEDYIIRMDFDTNEIIQAILSAILELANQDRQAFLNFLTQNEQSEVILVHRLLGRGLVQVAPHQPQAVLNYLLGDSRRLCVGDHENVHKETKLLIAAVCPYLPSQDLLRIEDTIRAFNYCLIAQELAPDVRFRFLQYNRQHRVKLILAFSAEYLSPQTKRWRDEEIRAFPWIVNETYENSSGIAQLVGAPMNIQEMTCASDKHLLNSFDKLADIKEEDYWKRQTDVSRAGGASSQAYEFSKLVKDDPQRFLRIVPKLQPQRHEGYAGNAIRELAETDFPTNTLIELVETLEQRGFVSEDFRSDAAYALRKIAEGNQGLPQSVLSLLENWLTTHSKPDLAHYRSEEKNSQNLKLAIFFGSITSDFLPSGRGSIIRAIAAGYLQQNPPDLQNWARVIKSRLGVEQHPAVWVDILADMPLLLNGDRQKATQLFDAVIRNCPEVLQYRWALYRIACCVGWLEPKETVQGWLEMLLREESSFCHQTYGELLFIHYFHYQDEWSVDRIHHHLKNQDDEAILCGLAHAASHVWFKIRCRGIATEILYRLASSSMETVQTAVAKVFGYSQENFELDPGMRKLISVVCNEQTVLWEAAPDIIEIIEDNDLVNTEPQLVSEICQALLGQMGKEFDNSAKSLVFAAESLTTFAIQLHRQDKYREVGLKIFEQLLALNLRETRSALEVLDRKPNRLNFYLPPQRRPRRRRKSYN